MKKHRDDWWYTTDFSHYRKESREISSSIGACVLILFFIALILFMVLDFIFEDAGGRAVYIIGLVFGIPYLIHAWRKSGK